LDKVKVTVEELV